MKKNKYGLKIATKEEVVWKDMKKITQIAIEDKEKALIIDRALLVLCDEKLEIEKFK